MPRAGFSLGTDVQDLVDELHVRGVETVVVGLKEQRGELGGRRKHQPSGKEKVILFLSFLF